MSTATVTLEIPDNIYQRLVYTASATKRPLEDIIIQALKVGQPPVWDNIPDEFQADLINLDLLDDQKLWEIATSKKTSEDLEKYDLLLSKNKNGNLTETEKLELSKIRHEFDIFMLRKAQSAALLHWRGYQVPNN